MSKNVLNVIDFYNQDYVNYGSYDNYRKIANYVDGLKPSARKVLYTSIEINLTQSLKLNRLMSKAAEMGNYLHGEQSMFGVIVGMAQNFIGTNNIPYFTRDGNFGTRFKQEASAARYIETKKEKYLDKFFRPEDECVLDEQIFEGDKIEPKFYLPVIPMLLANGSEGVSTGFAQKILPRNPKHLKEHLLAVLSGQKAKPISSIAPWYRGFKGKIKKGEKDASWEIYGNIEKLNATTYIINEVPIGYDLNDYKKELDTLEEKGVIRSYTDLSTDDKFKFEVKFQRSTIDGLTDEQLLPMLKLVKKTTENYTCCNEDLSITEFKTVDEIVNAYITVKKKYLVKRKELTLKKLMDDIIINASKYLFIKGIVEGTIKVQNVIYDKVITQLKQVQGIKEKDGSYDYLLNMPMGSLTKEKYEKLKTLINELKDKYKALEKKSIEQIWIDELNELNLDEVVK